MLSFHCLVAALTLSLSFALSDAQATLPLLPIPQNTMHFASLGDWGSPGPDQTNTAKQMGLTMAAFNASFLLAVGDNFYEDGVTSDTDPQWKTTYEAIYNTIAYDVPWYAIQGNHDHHLGRGQGQVDFYKNKRDTRWFMPDFWYDRVFHLELSNVTVHMVFIDTVYLAGDGGDKYPTQRAAQYAWINKTLQSSTADWLIVVGHYPIFTSGEHQKDVEVADLRTNLLPMLDANNVDFYIGGHDHTLQHLHESPSKTQYWVSGNGAKRGSIDLVPQGLFGVVDPGFMIHEVNGAESIITNVIDHYGKTVYAYSQKRIPKKHDKIKAASARHTLHQELFA